MTEDELVGDVKHWANRANETQTEIDALVDELISVKESLDHYQDRSIMHLRRYYEVASALGFKGHPIHAALIERAKELAMFARVA